MDTRIQNFPISFFSIIMGLVGFTIAIQKAETIFSFQNILSTSLLYFSVFLFVCTSILYLIKMLKYFPKVREELNNPIRLSFFPTFTISLLLMSIALLEINLELSKNIWILGTIFHLIATITILSMWVRQSKFEIQHFNPAWFIPIVGNMIVPIAGVVHFDKDLSWFFFSIGIVFWVLLFTIFLYRIIFHAPLPEKLIPTFFILIAPPAVGSISYLKLNGMIDNFAKILYFFAIFLVIFLMAQFQMFYKIKFYLSWWAYSFPIAAITIASAIMYKMTLLPLYKVLFLTLLSLLTLVILILFVRTVKAIFKGEICVKEE